MGAQEVEQVYMEERMSSFVDTLSLICLWEGTLGAVPWAGSSSGVQEPGPGTLGSQQRFLL